MTFNSVTYFVFLGIVLAAYYLLKLRLQNILLLAASYVFYGWWDYRFLSLLAISTVVDYSMGRVLEGQARLGVRRTALWVSLVTNLGILGFFKYFNFFADSFTELSHSVGFEVNPVVLQIILPVGISFYTFQTMAYTIDVYRGKMAPVRNFIDFALYVSFFPQLVAGPIERAQTLIPQIQTQRKLTPDKLNGGGYLILVGLFKKVVIADNCAPFVERCFDNPELYPAAGLMLGVWLFAVQIYCDFSGYTDIARGTAKLLGFDLMVNFRQPYFATNITDFWRRWHISLSSWLRDYLYIPLGGNRGSKLFTYRNLMLTMLLGGLWHGAAWTFVVWGGLHGLYLMVHKIAMGDRKPALQTNWNLRALCFAFLTFQLVCLTWVFFRAPDFSTAMQYVLGTLDWRGDQLRLGQMRLVAEPLAMFVAVTAAIFLLDVPAYRRDDQLAILRWPWPVKTALYTGLVLLLMLYGGGSDVAFIYFQF
ncbi:MAG: MBOAT family O-acyltransferase [Phycisphaeraceae bacterium]